MSTRRERSRIPRATRSSSPTNSTILLPLHDPRDSVTTLMQMVTPMTLAPEPHGVVHQTDRVLHVPVLPVRTHGSPSRMLRSGGTKEDAAKALPPLDVSILPSDEQTTSASTPTVHIPDVPGSTVPRMSFVSPPEGPAEVCGDCSRQD
ncbi:hypothetical protein PIB30_046336 [Stylosanthes scabra]|uniref:Uncharacterized protein n=1 Tax=Stylosanthes scabra TaxID=79078 RepID=A0ABU6VH47_9FABA|nr:hypothetical protein [Stylosanthes scabra]